MDEAVPSGRGDAAIHVALLHQLKRAQSTVMILGLRHKQQQKLRLWKQWTPLSGVCGKVNSAKHEVGCT